MSAESRALGADSRLTGGPSSLLAASAFSDELTAAPYLAPWLGVSDLAHVAMLVRARVIPGDQGRRLLGALLALEDEAASIPLDPTIGDVYNNRDAFLRDRIGPDAGVIHTGRARREATTIAWQLACRERLVESGRALGRIIDALISQAEKHRAAVMPDYTYLQAAQPTTLGHSLLGFVYPFLRDDGRLVAAFTALNRSPAGSGSVNGSRFALDREWAARLLRFDATVEHTRDAMWAPDLAVGQLSALASIYTNLDRLVEDLQIWATSEFGYVSLDDAHSRASVVMPHKKNPYALAWIRGRARFALGRWVGVVSTFLTPTGQPDNRITSYVEVPAGLDDARLCLDLAAELLDRATFDIEEMEKAANRGYLYATDLCDLLVERTGIDNRSAHRIVGLAVRERTVDGGDIEASDVVRAASTLAIALPPIDAADIEKIRDPRHVIALRRSLGGAADLPMQHMLDEVRARAAEAKGQWDSRAVTDFRSAFLDDIRSFVMELKS